jgi:hypothetical protein
MSRQTRRLLRWAGSAAGALAVTGCTLLALLYTPLPSPTVRARELAQAERRWASRPFARYRIVLRAASWCQVDVEIQGERVAQVFENTCPGEPKTVGDLFVQIRQLDSTPERVYCAPDGCECTETHAVEADYDAALGFPHSIRVRRPRVPNWQALTGYLLSRGLPSCLTPRDMEVINVVSLVPIT